jgi:hypothetical protein
MMKGQAGELRALLQTKCALLNDINKVLLIQEISMSRGEIQDVIRKCGEVNALINELTHIDSEIADADSASGLIGSDSAPAGDEEAGTLTNCMIGLAKQNTLILQRIENLLRDARADVRKELNSIILKSRISGYRPFIENQAIYVDRRN